MDIDVYDLDYKLIAAAESAQKEATKEWPQYERIFRNIKDEKLCVEAKNLNRSMIQTPIARDTVLIKRSIFTTSFMTKNFSLSINKLGEEDDEAARQLRIASMHMWKQSDAFVEINKAMLRMLVFPVGIMSQYWDPKKRRVVMEELNPMDVAFDPEARNADDVQYIVRTYRKTGKDILNTIRKDRKIKKKIKRFYNKLKDFDEFFNESYDKDTFENFKRYTFKEIYIRTESGWLCKTYLPERNILVRVAKFAESPIIWGFAREKLSSVVPEIREKEIMVYGESEIDYIKEHVEAMNKRRNQHSDIVEEQINPTNYIGTGAKVKASDLKRGPGGKIPVGDISQIRERRAPTTVGLHDDMQMLKDDIETTTSVNGLYKAATSSSDRRPTGAIALLSSQSSTRIEEQIVTANQTLFSHLAKSFVKKVYRYVDDETLMKLGIEDPVIGIDHPDKEEFDFVVEVEFGSTAKRDNEYAAYMEALQVLGQYQNVNPAYPEKLLTEAIKLRVGDEFRIDEPLILEPEPQPAPEAVAGNPIQEVIPGEI